MASLRAWTRRQFLVRSTSSLAVATLAKPHLSRAAARPQIAGGIQSGDVSDGSAVIWARADRPARMQVECSTKLLLNDLPLGQDIFYRVRFDDIAIGTAGESRIGHFRTAPAAGRSISFLWSSDTAGQGWTSTHRAAAIAAIAPCSTIVRTSSSIPAITLTPTARFPRSGSCRTARPGGMP
ncbi:phosphodiesterase/alkaline phosphatase D-like protein [Bradyrhizobium sp. LB1.3]